MPKVVSTLEFAHRTKDRMWQMMTRIYEQAARVINDQINIGNGWNSQFFDAKNIIVPNHVQPKCKDNLKGAIVYCTFGAANADLIITHNLGYIPRCYIPIWKAVACDVYDSPSAKAAATGNGPGLGLKLIDTQTKPDGTNPMTDVTTHTIPLRCTVASAHVLLFIF